MAEMLHDGQPRNSVKSRPPVRWDTSTAVGVIAISLITFLAISRGGLKEVVLP